jgi:photosynthetic reaction center cytochrome c subunit
VKVLTDLSTDQFNRVIGAALLGRHPLGDRGHHAVELVGREVRQHLHVLVARSMLRMVRHINADWQNHVGQTGVTCYTCHRGNPQPCSGATHSVIEAITRLNWSVERSVSTFTFW